MFGKDSKKAPAVPWALQFLTTDYLVTGLVAPAITTSGPTRFSMRPAKTKALRPFRC
jgi:hypothetical protein